MGLLILLLIGVAVGAYLVFFSLHNTQQVSLDLLFFYLHDTTVWQIVLISMAIGMGIAIILLLPAQLKAYGKARSFRGELKRTQAMLEEERRHKPATHTPAPTPAPALQPPTEEPSETADNT